MISPQLKLCIKANFNTKANRSTDFYFKILDLNSRNIPSYTDYVESPYA